jgi:hypothetical protein
MGRDIKCKDYFIIKVKFRDNKNKSNKFQWENAKKVGDFKWKLIEHVTGQTHTWWIWTHMMSSIECAFEEMDDKHGLLTLETGGYVTFLVPKNKPELAEWIQENCPFEYKVLKKTWLGWFHDATTWQRDRARDFTKRQIEGTLKDSYPKEYILD